MARRNYEISDSGFRRFLQEGRGQGEGRDYKPWLRVRDVPSTGFSHRVLGIKTSRLHEYFSYLEFCFHVLAEALPDVIDIREQFPMPRHETMSIARSLGIQHPHNVRLRNPTFMTTDIVLTTVRRGRRSLCARAVKPSVKLREPRVQQKLRIEEAWWVQRGFDWGVVTERQIPKTMLKNLERIRFAFTLEGHPTLTLTDIRVLQHDLMRRVQAADDLTYGMFCARFERYHRLEAGESHRLFANLLLRGVISVDFTKELSRSRPMSDFVCVACAGPIPSLENRR